MNKIAIIGAGQLGSRHLQGVKQSNKELDIWVIDPSKESLKIAKERYEQVQSTSTKSVHFITDISELPRVIDLAIIASSSKPRLSICKNLLENCKVDFMVLEKFLFPALSDYEEAENLFNEKGCKVWVNCPRRMFPYYKKIDSKIDKNTKINMEYAASNWGMCCNSIHLIDIFMKLCGEQAYVVNLSDVLPEVKESKRSGYIEFFGTEKITTAKGNQLILKCEEQDGLKSIISITNGPLKIEISEAKQTMWIDGKEEPIQLKFQSQLSGELTDMILDSANCDLTPFPESSVFHRIYLKELLSLYNKATGIDHDSCPVT